MILRGARGWSRLPQPASPRAPKPGSPAARLPAPLPRSQLGQRCQLWTAPFSDHLEESGFNLPRSDAAPFLRLPLTRPFPPDSPHPQRAHTPHRCSCCCGDHLHWGVGQERGAAWLSLFSRPPRAGPAWAQHHHAVGNMCFEMQGRVKYHMQSQAGWPFRPCIQGCRKPGDKLTASSQWTCSPTGTHIGEHQGKRFCKHAHEMKQRGSGPGALLWRAKTKSSPRTP